MRRPFGGLAVTASARRIGKVGGQNVSRRDVEPRRIRAGPTQEGAHHTRSIRESIHLAPGTRVSCRDDDGDSETAAKHGSKVRAWVAAAAVACGIAAAPLAAQTIGTARCSSRRRELTDVNFARAVVLVLRHDDDGTIGVVLNRPTNLVPATVFPELTESVGSYAGHLFRGGPIAPTRLLYLVRGSRRRP